MTKRPQRARDWEQFPITFEERQELIKHHDRQMRQKVRFEKRAMFNNRARANNIKHGIRPSKVMT